MAKILYFITDTDPLGIELAMQHKGEEVGICLLQDATYFACKKEIEKAINQGIKIYAAKKDVELRGLTKLIPPEVKVLDYSEIIDLLFDYEKVVNM
ncbi:hypothetical protein DRO19_00730 [Candidatus Bathyarchaeota archaeon]|nr:MAG: hypothetical protein DRO19_00730 [Candidatus Bathyarchaeota archaeon]